MRNKNYYTYVIACVLLIVFFIRTFNYIGTKSPTYDEHYYIGYGYSLLKTGDFRFRKDKTNLVPILSGIPLLFFDLKFSTDDENWIKGDTKNIANLERWALSDEMHHASLFNYKFLYQNSISADKIIYYARIPILLISLILGIFVFRWGCELFGNTAGILSLIFYTNSPNIIAHSGLATEDLVLSCFIFLCIYFYWKYYKTENRKYVILTGISMGFALNTKYTAVILIPTVVMYGIFELYKKYNKQKVVQTIKNSLIILGVACLILLVFYKFVSIKEYFLGMKFAAKYIKNAQVAFLSGQYSKSGF